jgi:hypothetical protein
MTPPDAQTDEQKRLQQNIEKTTKMANDMFPNETWIDAGTLKLKHVKLPDGADGIMVARSRLPMNQRKNLFL